MFVKEKRDAKKLGVDYGLHPLARQTLFLFHHSQAFFQTFSVRIQEKKKEVK